MRELNHEKGNRCQYKLAYYAGCKAYRDQVE
jgi:hypothetical protein